MEAKADIYWQTVWLNPGKGAWVSMDHAVDNSYWSSSAVPFGTNQGEVQIISQYALADPAGNRVLRSVIQNNGDNGVYVAFNVVRIGG